MLRLNAPLRCYATAILPALALPGFAWAGGNPGFDRPGLGFSAAVLPPGAITWEQGLPDWNESDGVWLYSADTLVRIGLGGPLELQLGTSYDRLSDRESIMGRGDSSLGLKFALPAEGRLRWGLLGTVTFTDGAREFRGDSRQYSFGAVVNWQLTALSTLGAYAENTESSGGNDHLFVVNAGRALTNSLNGYIEAAWQHAAGVGDGSMAGGGLAWEITPRVQLDGSFRHRVSGVSATWEGGLGVSVYFGPL